MKILIVGAGIAGLSLANMLEQRDWEVRIVDRVQQWDRVGYGIGLWRNGLRIVDDLDLLDPLRERGTDVRTWEMRRADGSLLNRLDVSSGDGPSDLLVIHRADFHEVLRDPLSDQFVEMGTSVKRLDRDETGTTVEFTDGSSQRFDLVVGADGINSKVRDLGFDGWTLNRLDTVSFSVWIPPEGPDFDHPVEWLGPEGTTLLVSPAGDRAMANFGIALDRGVEIDDPLRFLRQRTRSFGWIIPEIFESIPDDADVFWTRNREVEASRWYSERTVLVGDAAHALHPIVGMGASLALEDSRLLYELLSDKAPDHIVEALRHYEARRKKRLRRFSRLSWLTRKVLLTRSSLIAGLRDFVLARSSSLMDLFVSDTDPVERSHRS